MTADDLDYHVRAMKAMILAAGYGTRMRPVTYTLPKPMVPLCNRPLIAWAAEGFLRAGIDELVVNLHHLPGPIETYLHTRFSGEAFLHFSFEPEILGTGGGVRKVQSLFENEQDFFLANGDTIQFPNYDELLRARRAGDVLAAITLRHSPDDDHFTPVFCDQGRVTGFGRGEGEALMFSGTHCLSSRLFRYLPAKEFSGMIDEVYQPVLDNGAEDIAAVVDDGPWFDVGTPQRYMAASRGLLELMLRGDIPMTAGSRAAGDSLIDDSADIRGTVAQSTIGARSVIEGRVDDSAVWDDCHIGKGVSLEGCIVAHGVKIDGNRALRNAMICRDEARIPRDGEYVIEEGLVIAAI